MACAFNPLPWTGAAIEGAEHAVAKGNLPQGLGFRVLPTSL